MTQKIKVMVVDDSPVFRALLSEIINSDPKLMVVAAAEDPYQARELIKQHNPDVLTLDIEMPKMNGVQFLKNLMRLRPMPVVMISTLTQHGADVTLQALEIGAVDYFPKPAIHDPGEMIAYRKSVTDKIKMAAGANVDQEPSKPPSVIERASATKDCQVIAIGASTGGTEAVRHVLSSLPDNLPPIVITQHISALFSASFAQRLNDSSSLTVTEVTQNDTPLKVGHAYVAPGDKHLVVVKRGAQLYGCLDDSAPVNRHKPSVDVMFEAVAEVCGGKSVGAILTGMGSDGAKGMFSMKKQGAFTLAQDEKSSVVYGMPRVAAETGAAQSIVPLDKIAKVICQSLTK
ncbi:chemotaxis response regulator protein-glutamate methylesterase [Vibrio sp. SCSIO 43136]|uniref:protein-glutamate methylesterase/protein-glutamine glutaminase n=1 Tax=Vibrio sp. SCSIO 43136 TaxID=2819101 RepID=UPI0020764175|nr:chemotaxis response regulator protein-glutamate methylesterase [Vibrio sp. SCSIO 43136]USD67480.1 chemotaxis response regulator protein-glutamate methylesterase [Vibrio sp. SCSIO 43136]